MGKLITNEDGTHSFVGGFSTKNPEDMKQLSDNFIPPEFKKQKKQKKSKE